MSKSIDTSLRAELKKQVLVFAAMVKLAELDRTGITEELNSTVDALEALVVRQVEEASHLHRYAPMMGKCQICDLTPDQLIENTERLLAANVTPQEKNGAPS